jgi:hypothetical protein
MIPADKHALKAIQRQCQIAEAYFAVMRQQAGAISDFFERQKAMKRIDRCARKCVLEIGTD